MKRKIKSHLNLIIVGVLALVFFVATSSFNYFTQEPGYVKWSSPDETANYFFAKSLSEGQGLSFFDPAATLDDNMVMPRSFRSDAGWLKPVSFLGIILIYGSLGSCLGSAVIPFLTPFFAALGIIIFYLLIKRVFNARIGLISAFLLAFFPVYIYYTVRSMFHNVLFIVLLLLAIYLLILAAGRTVRGRLDFSWQKFLSWRVNKQRWLQVLAAFFSGIFFGLTITTRTSEIIWLAPVVVLVWFFYAKRLGLLKLVIALCGFTIALLPAAYFNQMLYSAPLYGGYNEMNRSLDDISRAGSGIADSFLTDSDQLKEYLRVIYNNVFYFGLKPQQSLFMAEQYIWRMFPALSKFFLLGVLVVIILNIRRPEKKYLAYFLAFLILSAILIVYYGSWKFNDNPNPNRYTIGNSYTRYWLPIYLLMMPIAALAIVRLSRALLFIGRKAAARWQKIIASGIQAVFVLFFIVSGVDFVMYGSEEGLAHLYYNNMRDKEHVLEVIELTEAEGIIITRYYDKFLFPERRIIMGTITNEEVLKAAGKLVYRYPVYYYNFYLNSEDIAYLNARKLPPYGLEIALVKKISSDFGLYRLSAAPTLLKNAGEEEVDIKK